MTDGKQESDIVAAVMSSRGKPSDTRDRILVSAQELFLRRGYHASTLQEIASDVGISKPALYYHFESKSDILDALLMPLTAELDAALDEAVAANPAENLVRRRRMLLAAWTDVFLRYRGTLFALMRELGAVRSERFEQMVLVMGRAIEVTAGRSAEKEERIRVAQAISAIMDPVALLPGMSAEDLREPLLEGVWRLLDMPDESADRVADPGGGVPTRGRPRARSAQDRARARQLYDSGAYSAAQIAQSLGVSRATVYRYLKS